MGVQYTVEQRAEIAAGVSGEKIDHLEHDDEGDYWVMVLCNGTEFCFRFMSELT